MSRLSHTAPETVGAAIERCARAMRRARLHFGHGTDNARDEAAELVFFAAVCPTRRAAPCTEGPDDATARAYRLAAREANRAKAPLAYLTHRAFFAGLELYVDERVLVPRSPIAELIRTASSLGPSAPRAQHSRHRHRLGRHRARERGGLPASAVTPLTFPRRRCRCAGAMCAAWR